MNSDPAGFTKLAVLPFNADLEAIALSMYSSPHHALAQGKYLMETRQFEKAKLLFLDVLSDPENDRECAASAYCCLGILHEFFLPREKQALEFYRKASELNSPQASVRLAEYYADKDRAISTEYYKRAASTGQSPTACMALYRHYRGSETQQHWLQEAAKAGDSSASYALGQHEEHVKNDLEQAIYWYEMGGLNALADRCLEKYRAHFKKRRKKKLDWQ